MQLKTFLFTDIILMFVPIHINQSDRLLLSMSCSSSFIAVLRTLCFVYRVLLERKLPLNYTQTEFNVSVWKSQSDKELKKQS